MKWNSVKTPPKRGECFIVVTDIHAGAYFPNADADSPNARGITLAMYDDGHWFDWLGDGDEINVTHWRGLPRLPKQ